MANTSTPSQSTYQQKRMSFYRDSNIRQTGSDKDRQYLNVFLESEKTPNTNEKTYWLRKRGGLKPAGNTITGTEVRGTLSYEGRIFYILDRDLYKFEAGYSTYVNTLGSNNGNRCGMVIWNDNNEVDYIVIGDGTTLWTYDLYGSGGIAAVTDGYPTPFIPEIQSMDGYIFMVKAGTGDIYNSQVEDMSTGNWDYITAEMYPDTIRGFSRYNNYLAALGRESLELFYDAAIETGSPLARNESTVITVGCSCVNTIVQSEAQLFWVGNAQEGQLGIWQLENFKVTEITTPWMRKVLSDPDLDPEVFTAHMMRHMGRKFYVLVLGTTGRFYTQIWVYDMEEKFWYQWDFGVRNGALLFGADINSGATLLVAPTGVLTLDEKNYIDFGDPIDCQWTTDAVDFGTMNRKMAYRLTMLGDVDGDPQIIKVTWSDDNYQTWAPERDLIMSNPRPAIVNLGMFRKRAWRCKYSTNLPLRIEGMELYYNLMGN